MKGGRWGHTPAAAAECYYIPAPAAGIYYAVPAPALAPAPAPAPAPASVPASAPYPDL
eukprot:CAMPEP_0173204116 /NCGR_PEP_ID=MMETSP1141-20130122/19911_1 /TAXON_ID=483371 /ORGANISM="non described non described, Strain CCMP2298" /LENGTH=57 /DNA_ID=CAMNT_0014129679 /DNA_START=141 /DNA_END=318 /DNA_ORIENTATION=-